MKAIVLHQPWASLMAFNEKQIETRSWPTKHRGPLAICAAKGFPQKRRSVCFDEPFEEVLKRHEIYQPGDLPLGCVVAVVDVINCVSTDDFVPADLFAENEASFGNYQRGRFAWLTANVRALTIPLPIVGRQGFFNIITGVCRVCACTDECACEGGCSWVEPDLCSACKQKWKTR